MTTTTWAMNVHIMTRALYSLIKNAAPGIPPWEEYRRKTGAHSPLWDPETVYIVSFRENEAARVLVHESLHLVLRRAESQAACTGLDNLRGHHSNLYRRLCQLLRVSRIDALGLYRF